ncbi:MAG: DNA ligase D, partial [Candidatus Binataceae bacterium]
MALERYREKRVPGQTPEPFGTGAPSPGQSPGELFVVQRHAARRLHYDFRLEMEGVLRSWAIPKGPSLNPNDKRLAVMVEDHPVEYADFEGLIPESNYGAGSVIVWDRGTYRLIDPPGADAASAVANGKLDIELRGFKLHGAFTLVRTKSAAGHRQGGKETWLLIKKRDAYTSEREVTLRSPRSVLSGLTLEEVRDAPALVGRVRREIEREGAPRLAHALDPKRFPLALARLIDAPFNDDKWLFELKYDGVRALAVRDGDNVRAFARSGAEITETYPEIARSLKALPFEQFVIDGEIIAAGEDGQADFQLLQRRIHVRGAAAAERLSRTIPVCYFAFDLLAFDGFDLRRLPLKTRKRILALMVGGEGPLRYCDHTIGRGHEFFEAVEESGLEGIIAKQRDSSYKAGRGGDWLKIKCPLTKPFVIGGYTDPQGSRSLFGALLLGRWDNKNRLRFVGKVGTGFSDQALQRIHRELTTRETARSPFARSAAGEREIPRNARFTQPELVCEVRFAELTDDGYVRHASFLGLVPNADAKQCRWEALTPKQFKSSTPVAPGPSDSAQSSDSPHREGGVAITHRDKVFWAGEGYTKADLVKYYRDISPWMLPYLKDRPVMITRYPDGIEGKSFYQKDAPAYAPKWIRTEKIYSEDSRREIAYFILENADALAYVANLGTIPIHIWSSRISTLERPDWLLFDIDPKGSTTAKAVEVARAVMELLK